MLGLISKVAYALALKAASLFALLLFNIQLGRILGAEDFGVFSFGLTCAVLTGIAVSLGFPQALIKLIPEYITYKNWSELRGVLIRSHQLVIITALMISVVLLVLTLLLPLSSSQVSSLRFSALILPLVSLVRLRRFIFQAYKKITASIFPFDILLPIVVILWVVIGNKNTVYEVFKSYFVVSIVLFLGITIWLIYSVQKDVFSIKSTYHTKTWVLLSFPMMIGGLCQMSLSRIDIVILGAMSEMTVVGLYSVSIKIASLHTFVLGGINVIVAPRLSAAFAEKNLVLFQKLIRISMILSGLGALPVFLVVILFPEMILGVFGSDFIKADRILIMLSCGQLINAVCGPVGFALIVSNNERFFARINGAVAICNLFGLLIIVPIYDALGAAIINCFSFAILNISMLHRVKKIKHL